MYKCQGACSARRSIQKLERNASGIRSSQPLYAYNATLPTGGKFLPPSNHNLRAMSMSFLLPPSSRTANAVIWRGLMVQKATQQLLFDVDWSPGLDVLVVDLPPGTGDVQLTLAQLIKIDGVVVVSTPQEVALADVKKGVDMFRKTGVPVSLPFLVFHLHSSMFWV